MARTHARIKTDLAARTHALYRFFDEEGALLYVGITHHPDARWSQHRSEKPWWHEVRTITVEPHPDRPTVLAAERAAIFAEEPRWNAEIRLQSWDPRWISESFDHDRCGTIATYTELHDGLYISILRPLAATVDALVDLRAALRDHVATQGATKKVVITVPEDSERGERSALLFGAEKVTPWRPGLRFTSRLEVKTSRRLAESLDNHFGELLAGVVE